MKITPRILLVLAILLLCMVAAVPAGNASASNVFASPVPTVVPTAIPPVATAAPITMPPVPAPILGTHIVKQGETLYCIGRAYSISPWAIASVNAVPWPYTIYVGQALKIPNVPWFNIPSGPVCVPQFPGGTPAPTPVPTIVPTPGPTPTPPPGCTQSYVIQPGDTLFGISSKFGVDMYTLAANNHIFNLNLIFAYSTICIK